MSRAAYIERLMNEVVLYGGLPLRRCDVLRVAAEDAGGYQPGRFGADYFAFKPEAVDAEPLTIDQFRKLTGDSK